MHLILLVCNTGVYFLHNLPQLSLKMSKDYTDNQQLISSQKAVWNYGFVNQAKQWYSRQKFAFEKLGLIHASLKVQSQHELKLHINGESNMLSYAVTFILVSYHQEVLKSDSIPLRVWYKLEKYNLQ